MVWSAFSSKEAKRLTKACDFNNIVSVLVGKLEVPFVVHKDLLCVLSKFFEAAFSCRWLEGQKKLVKLPEISPCTFQTYVGCVYSSKITINTEEIDDAQLQLLDLYILGDVVDDYRLRNAAMEEMMVNLAVAKNQPHPTAVTSVYERTLVGSPLRQLLVDWKRHRGNRSCFSAHVAEYPVEFVQELAVAMMDQTPTLKRKETRVQIVKWFVPEMGST